MATAALYHLRQYLPSYAEQSITRALFKQIPGSPPGLSESEPPGEGIQESVFPSRVLRASLDGRALRALGESSDFHMQRADAPTGTTEAFSPPPRDTPCQPFPRSSATDGADRVVEVALGLRAETD